mmetsp:Transcript_11568/g.18369  ORF Transcript_11568/g.18369 Transcript_11568/m.18369 type:complete len:208 (-) Transcript_11568:61-684(-)
MYDKFVDSNNIHEMMRDSSCIRFERLRRRLECQECRKHHPLQSSPKSMAELCRRFVPSATAAKAATISCIVEQKHVISVFDVILRPACWFLVFVATFAILCDIAASQTHARGHLHQTSVWIAVQHSLYFSFANMVATIFRSRRCHDLVPTTLSRRQRQKGFERPILPFICISRRGRDQYDIQFSLIPIATSAPLHPKLLRPSISRQE